MQISEPRPIKVLNALWQLDAGRTESSLVDILRHLDRREIQMDFLVTSAFEGHFDSAVRQMGARVVLGKERFSPSRNLRELAEINQRFGPYDVIHCHRHYGGAPLLKAAQQLGIPVRIAHSQGIRVGKVSVLDRAGIALARHLTRKYCTHGLAVSHAAATSLFGPRWESDPHIDVLPLGCNFDSFRLIGSREQVRRELEINEDEIALIHVGSYTITENYEFILAVANALKKLSARFRIVLIGDGPLLEHVRWQVRFAGLTNRVLLLSAQPDLPELFLAMDAFIFPPEAEEFSVAAIEAQAAGLVCFLADRVVPEVDVVPELLHRLPLEVGPEAWAREIVAHGQAAISQDRALEQCRASNLDIETGVERLRSIYAGVMADSSPS